jgi:diacylglycerol kinase family enzyme
VRTDQTPWHFLLNPAAGRGKALRKWQKWLPVLQASLPEMTVAISKAEKGMAALAEAAVRSGKTHLVGVGGDGTHHDILNGIIQAGGLNSVTYAPLPLGTGNDWVRTLRTPRNVNAWLKMASRQQTMNHRVGKLVYSPTPPTPEIKNRESRIENRESPTPPTSALPTTHHQLPITYFLNVAGLAYDAEVVRRSEKSRWKSRWLYPLMTLLYLKGFTPPSVKIDYGENTFTGLVHTINIGVCRYSGGGMRLVPQADPLADTLALTFAKRLPIWKILLSSWRFYTGTIGAIKEVTTTHVREVRITPITGFTGLEADGELLGEVPVTASLLEEYLRVVV